VYFNTTKQHNLRSKSPKSKKSLLAYSTFIIFSVTRESLRNLTTTCRFDMNLPRDGSFEENTFELDLAVKNRIWLSQKIEKKTNITKRVNFLQKHTPAHRQPVEIEGHQSLIGH
jgi:hypothetical protein